MSEILTAIPADTLAIINGSLITLLVALVRPVFGAHWEQYERIVKLGVVALMAALWAGFMGWKMLGLSGAALVAHVVVAFVSAIGTHQAVKAAKEKVWPPPPGLGRSASIETKLTS